ncbi:MAG: KaiC domain-containing protein [Methanobacteriota archaeon]|nr:MAG: KaiC domain-containing protein [Euryarchaeota archaeon]
MLMKQYIYSLNELSDKAPKMFGIKTGTKLDNMFFTYDEEDGRVVKKTLYGLPYLGVLNIVGSPDTGKSLFAYQFAVFQASIGYKVVILTTETPASFLYNTIRERCLIMSKDFEEVARNIVVVDLAQEDSVRENINEVISLLERAINKHNATITIIDSVTGLYEHKELNARRVLRAIYNFLKARKQTALITSQKRSSKDSSTVEAAGGLGVAHIVDGSIVLDKRIINTKYEEGIYGMPIGSVMRTLRIDGCRLAGHDQRTHILKISDTGVIDVGEELSEYLKANRKEI